MKIPKSINILTQKLNQKGKVTKKNPKKIPQARTPSTSKASKLGKQTQRRKHTQSIKKKGKSEKGR